MIQTPDWVKHAVFYQIFPDRFARGSRNIHPQGIQFKPWGASPREQGYQGGDLYGVVEKLDYLVDLGINALYLNPIFSAASNHRYNAYDYMAVDPLLGGDGALRRLLDEAHRRDIRVVLDGVLNHCGRGFWAFHPVLESGNTSPYMDWFHISSFPLNPYPAKGQKPNYTGWWGHPSLPKFNTDNPGVRDYLFQVTKYWMEFGADGWRLDVPEDIQDDEFWREFRRIVKGVDPEKYIVGEIWHAAESWLKGDMFDAVMNYIITNHILGFFGASSLDNSWDHPDITLKPLDGSGFAKKIDEMFALYDWEIHYAQLNMMDSHDMPRALWLLRGDEAAFKLAILCQMTMPGAPCVYYGDEVGMAAGGDPDCREAFPWDRDGSWNDSIRDHYRAAIRLRHQHPALRTGDFAFIKSEGACVAYRRRLNDEEILVAFNAGKQGASLSIPSSELSGSEYRFAWGGAGHTSPENGNLHLHMGPQAGLVLVKH